MVLHLYHHLCRRQHRPRLGTRNASTIRRAANDRNTGNTDGGRNIYLALGAAANNNTRRAIGATNIPPSRQHNSHAHGHPDHANHPAAPTPRARAGAAAAVAGHFTDVRTLEGSK